MGKRVDTRADPMLVGELIPSAGRFREGDGLAQRP
jgi:hypothetical protein